MSVASQYRIGAVSVVPRASRYSMPCMVAYDPAGLFAAAPAQTIVLEELDGVETLFPHCGVVVHMSRTDAAGTIVKATPELRKEAESYFAEDRLRPTVYMVARTGTAQLHWSRPNVVTPMLLQGHAASRDMADFFVADIMLLIGRGWRANPMTTFTNSPCRRAPHLTYQLGFTCGDADVYTLPPKFGYKCHDSMAGILVRAGVINGRLCRKRSRKAAETPSAASAPEDPAIAAMAAARAVAVAVASEHARPSAPMPRFAPASPISGLLSDTGLLADASLF